MIGLYNADSSFFNISSDDVALSKQVVNDDVIGLTIQEEIGKATSGSLQLNDPNNVYAGLMTLGIKLNISWGYKDADTSIRSVTASQKNPSEMQGTMVREGMTAYVMSPSGSGNENGHSVFNCNFYGTEWSKSQARKVYKAGTKSSVVVEVLRRMGVSFWDVMFERGHELITPDTQVLQWETDFKFLQRIARDWRVMFRIGYMASGRMYAMFVDFDKFDQVAFSKMVTGASFGNSIQLDYKYGLANVRSYKWQNHAGESGTGDHVKIVWVGGKPTFIRYIAEGQTVRAYRFVPSKITKELERRGNTGGISAQTEYMKWATMKVDFNSMRELVSKGYFVPVDVDTAPQGVGYSVNVEMLGNPLITPPMLCKFGEGFPDNLASYQFKIYLRKVEHSISKDGYRISAEAVDTLTLTGGSFVY